MPLYEVALIKMPTKKESADGAKEELILPPTPKLAPDDRTASVMVLVENAAKTGADLSQIQVLVRPFA